METSRDAQAQAGLTLYFLGKTHAGLRKLSAYYRQRGFRVSNVAEPAELGRVVNEQPPDVILIDLQSRNDVSEFMDALAANPGSAGIPTVAIISSTTDAETAEELNKRCDSSVSWPLKATELSVKLFHLLVEAGRAIDIEADPRDPRGALYRGRIQGGLLRPLLQILYLSRKDGLVSMESEGRRGSLWLKDGKLIDAQVGALDWEESLDLIRRFVVGTFSISFQEVDRRRFIERGALHWLAEREQAEAAARAVEEEDGEVAMSFIDVDDDRDDLDARGLMDSIGPEEPTEADEITTSTSPFAADEVSEVEADSEQGDEDSDAEEAAVRTLPALKAVRDAETRHFDDEYEDEDDEEEDDDDYEDDDDDYDDYDDYEEESESTVARVSIRIGRVTREELERQMRLDALGIEDQPFSGTRVAPPPTTAPPVEAQGPASHIQAVPVLSIAAEEAPESEIAQAEALSDDERYQGPLPDARAPHLLSTVGADYDEDDYDEDDEDDAIAAAAAAVVVDLPLPPSLTEPAGAPELLGEPEPLTSPLAPPQAAPVAAPLPPVAEVSPPAAAEPVQPAAASSAAPPAGAAAALPPRKPVAAQPPASTRAAQPPRSPSRPPTPVASLPEDSDRGRPWIVPVVIVIALLLFVVFNPFKKKEETTDGPQPVAGVPDEPLKPVGPPLPANDGRTEREVIRPAQPVIQPADAPADRPPEATPAHKPPESIDRPASAGADKPPVASQPPTEKDPRTSAPPTSAAHSPASGQPPRQAPPPRTTQPAAGSTQPAGGTTQVASKPPQTAVTKPPVEPRVSPPTPAPAADAGTQDADAAAAKAAEDFKRTLTNAAAKEKAGDYKAAAVLYAQAAQLDKTSQEARDGLERTRARGSEPTVEPGELFINSLPYGLVYIDGEKIGYTPYHKLDAVPREYVIRITNPEYGACETVRQVRPGERTFVYLKLDDDEACNRTPGSP